MKKFIWFLGASWSYLGCNSGSGRWKARVKYFREIVPTSIRFIKLSWND